MKKEEEEDSPQHHNWITDRWYIKLEMRYHVLPLYKKEAKVSLINCHLALVWSPSLHSGDWQMWYQGPAHRPTHLNLEQSTAVNHDIISPVKASKMSLKTVHQHDKNYLKGCRMYPMEGSSSQPPDCQFCGPVGQSLYTASGLNFSSLWQRGGKLNHWRSAKQDFLMVLIYSLINKLVLSCCSSVIVPYALISIWYGRWCTVFMCSTHPPVCTVLLW